MSGNFKARLLERLVIKLESSLYYGTGWYFNAREKFIKNFVGSVPTGAAVLDVGCGNGLVARNLLHAKVVGIDPNPGYEFGIKGSADDLPFADNGFDMVTCFDVLEHIENDHQAIAEIHRVLKPQGTAYISVPLYPSLWSRHDEVLGHYRRYEQGQVTQMLEARGFREIRRKYFLGTMLPAIYLIRKLFPRQKVVSKTDVGKFDPILEKLALFNDWPFGLSEYLVFEKVQ